MQLRFCLSTSIGDRENNEDDIGMYQSGSGYCFVLADGLGGHEKGEVASRLAVESAITCFACGGEEDKLPALSFERAQNAVLEKQKEGFVFQDMKTTMVLLHIGSDTIRWGHIGDSRLYYFEKKKLVTRTLDHSVPQMLAAAGQIKESEIRHHPDRNRLLRVLGLEWDEPKYEIAAPVKVKGNQQFLLCSDGLWDWIDEKKMTRCLRRSSSPDEWVNAIKKAAETAGEGNDMDNYSAIAVWID